MGKANIFEGKKVRLRAFEPGDAPALLAYLNHPALTGRRYLPGGLSNELPLSTQQVEAALRSWGEARKSVHLAIERLADGALCGHAEMEWEWDPHCPFLAVVIAPPAQRQGLGTDAARLLLGYLFGYTPAHSTGCGMADWNAPARAFASRLGFQECGRFRREGLRDGRYTDGIVMDLLRPEWLEKQEKTEA